MALPPLPSLLRRRRTAACWRPTLIVTAAALVTGLVAQVAAYAAPLTRGQALPKASRGVSPALLGVAAAAPLGGVAVVHAETMYNMQAVGAAAGMDPNLIIEQPPQVQVFQAIQDFTGEFLIPYLIGGGFVYGVALTFGFVEGPFPTKNKKDDSK
mmetsp:Transcript_122167/g.273059  ORF Transcript_122167/g.273059 Transcript_122167/m.273059 type:complete len:155 (+) Transcript_122167:59-523(+)